MKLIEPCHIIDSWTLPRAWDIMDRAAHFAVEQDARRRK